MDKEPIREAYEDVRDDNSDTAWSVMTYNDGNEIVLLSKGTSFDEFKSHFVDDQRVYGFIRIYTGDELSKRAKFAFISWSGQNVSPIKRAKMSTDKPLLKQVIQNFALETHITDLHELTEEAILEEVKKAGGANYGTGSRD